MTVGRVEDETVGGKEESVGASGCLRHEKEKLRSVLKVCGVGKCCGASSAAVMASIRADWHIHNSPMGTHTVRLTDTHTHTHTEAYTGMDRLSVY